VFFFKEDSTEFNDGEATACKWKFLTLASQTAQAISFSPTIFNALVRHAEQRG
jgi:hypothetical protein